MTRSDAEENLAGFGRIGKSILIGMHNTRITEHAGILERKLLVARMLMLIPPTQEGPLYP